MKSHVFFRKVCTLVFIPLAIILHPIGTLADKNSESQIKKSYVILVSIDGFRHDYIEKYKPKNLTEIKTKGVSAKSLIPVFPTKTFPNHYTLATGMYPAKHGIVDNSFYDPKWKERYSISDPFTVSAGKWYGGTPLWVLAEQSGMISASYFWVGSEAEIKGTRPTYFHYYDNIRPNDQRVNAVVEWLKLSEEKRPHMILLYFSLVDNAGHDEGPGSDRVAKSVAQVDELIGSLRTQVSSLNLPVNLVIVSDHGMTQLDDKKTIPLYDLIDLKEIEVAGGGAFVSLHITNKKKLNAIYNKLKSVKNMKVHLRKDIPKRFRLNNTNRIGDIVLIADLPYYIATKPPRGKNNNAGMGGSHGWDNQEKEMHGIFLAEGPQLKSGVEMESFESIHVYPFITKILALENPKDIDGKANVTAKLFAADR